MAKNATNTVDLPNLPQVHQNRYCSKAKTEESHFLWRIEAFRLAIQPQFVQDTLQVRVVVGQSLLGHPPLQFRFALESLERLSPEEDSKRRRLVRRLERAQVDLAEARERLREAEEARDNPNNDDGRPPPPPGEQLRELEDRVRTAERESRQVEAELSPLNQRIGLDYRCKLRLVCRFESNNNLSSSKLPLTSKRLQVRIRKQPGLADDITFDSEMAPESELPGKGGWQMGQTINYSVGEFEKLLLVDEALRVEIKLSVSQLCDAGNEAEVSDYETCISSLMPQLISLAPEEYSSDNMTVTLGCCEVGDGDEEGAGERNQDEEMTLSSCKVVLSARSSVLAGLFVRHPEQTHFKLEVNRRTLGTLVKYLHAGELPPEGFSSASEILEVAAAAVKYGLPELFSYCDEILTDYCCMETASYLLVKSRELRLFKSSQAIMEYVTDHSMNFGFDIKQQPLMNANTNKKDEGGEVTNPRTWMNHNYTTNEIITTGVIKNRYPFTWEIQNFKELVHSLAPQPLTLQNTKITGCLFDPEAKWELTLAASEEEGGTKIKITMTLKYLRSAAGRGQGKETSSSSSSNVHFYVVVGFGAERNGNRTTLFSSSMVSLADQFAHCCILDKDNPHLADASGSLILGLRLSVYSNLRDPNSTTFSACQALRLFRQRSTERLERYMGSLYQSFPISSDVTIKSKEGYQFFAHWRILGVRCAAFKSMFESGMEERRSGLIKLDDIPHNAVDIMLCYIYTGRIPVARFSTAMDFIDVAYVAEKYDLSGLRSYCDDNLGRQCNLANVGELLSAAVTYRLSNAVSAIQKYISSKASSSRNSSEYSEILLAGFSSTSSSSSSILNC